MNIVVISDKYNAERRENVCKEFGEYNLEFSFFDAIMANKMSKEELATKALKNTFLTPSEIGCALSHIGVYKKFLKSNQKSIYHHKCIKKIVENMNVPFARDLFCTYGYIINRAVDNNIESIVDSGSNSDSTGESQHTVKKNIAIKDVYNLLLLKGVLVVNVDNLKKHISRCLKNLTTKVI